MDTYNLMLCCVVVTGSVVLTGFTEAVTGLAGSQERTHMAPSVSHLTAVSNIVRSAAPTLKEAVEAYHRAVFEAKATIRAAERAAEQIIAEAREGVLRAKLEQDIENEAIDPYDEAEAILTATEGL